MTSSIMGRRNCRCNGRRMRITVSAVLLLQAVAWVSRPAFHRQRRRRRRAFSSLHSSSFDSQEDKLDLKLLLLDHYDSFTYNLADLLAQICHTSPTVLAADCAQRWNELQDDNTTTSYDGIILSPGPGNPETCGTLSKDIVRCNPHLPILGVCLGHQILGQVYGATVTCAPQPIHGQVKGVRLLPTVNNTDPLWNDMPTNFQVTRYHSLHVTDLNETDLMATAMADDDDVVMAARHKHYPHFGVQFHPESVGTPAGKQLLQNFCQICAQHKQQSKESPSTITKPKSPATKRSVNSSPYSVYIHHLQDCRIRPVHVMEEFLKDEPFAFWLDDATADMQSQAFSILGSSKERIEYWGKDKPANKQGMYVWNKEGCWRHDANQDILTYLGEKHAVATESATMISFDNNGSATFQVHAEEELDEQLSFDYRGGHVGYLGYEVRHDTSRYLEEQEQGHHHETFEADHPITQVSDPKVPTAAFVWADKSFVYDHQSGDWYIVGVALKDETSADDMVDWMRLVSFRMQQREEGINGKDISKPSKGSFSAPIFAPNRSRKTYNENFDECLENIRQGESYELCLTNQLETTVKNPGSRPVDLYKVLRRRNPAPFSAFFNWNGEGDMASETNSAVSICCSSPERFVSVKRKRCNSNSCELEVEAKPIKGTCARIVPVDGSALTDFEKLEDMKRAQELQSSVKNRAENLMIVDLLRNDLSRVCETGSVHVAKLMDIESYATVHQMVSTIRGTLNPSTSSAVDVLKACFPGGSMTGAPKLRTMELLDEMEEGVSRGPYSGCLGYISANGSMDMNIIIRTAVLTRRDECDAYKIRIGAGGAITALSESNDEYEEMLLKASAVMKAVGEWAAEVSSPDVTCTDAIPTVMEKG